MEAPCNPPKVSQDLQSASGTVGDLPAPGAGMLTATHLSVAYGPIKVVRDVSFQVPAGSIVALIGANGAGKTTTLRALSGLERAASGNVLFKGRDITRMPAHLRVALGLCQVPEGRKIFPALTVLENLELAGWTVFPKRKVATRIREVFDLFPRIRDRRGQLGGTLSGGEQQMVAMGRALVTGGDLLLLDEPSMGLAPLLVEEIFGLIAEMHLRGTTIILVEQNAAQALALARQAHVMETGRIAFSGDAATLSVDPRVREAYLGA